MIQIVFVCGMSGAGKTTAQSTLEDLGYMCIDNMPATFIPLVIDLAKKQQDSETQKLGFIFDFKFHKVSEILRIYDQLKVKQDGYEITLLFLDAENAALLGRYKESRRKHPLAQSQVSLSQAIEKEREMATLIEHVADMKIDTTHLSAKEFVKRLDSMLGKRNALGAFTVNFMSFGFKYGIPQDADFVLDVRYLPNPFYDMQLRVLTGQHPAVQQFVHQSEGAKELFERTEDYLGFLLKGYQKEGRNNVVIAVGCTGGQHRSVTLIEQLNKVFSGTYICFMQHRDMKKNLQEVIERYQ